ncbi:MAG: TATA-box-binding protein [Chrysothrix sp. TS-e1954]|nr:MAG: TATA-box-binding protein [Chrysothrix sp. TS-e1954]
MARASNVATGLRTHPKNAKQAKQVYDANFAPSSNEAEDEQLENRQVHEVARVDVQHTPADTHRETNSLAEPHPASASTSPSPQPPQATNEPTAPAPTPSLQPPPQSLEMPPSTLPKLQNFTATVNLHCQIDLSTLNQSARNTEYNPKRFAAVILRIRSPRTTSLVFSNGRMVITGSRSESDSKLGGRKCAAIIQKCGFSPRWTDFSIRNVVATADAGFVINVEEVARRHGNYSSYEPEIFPACVYRMLAPRVVLMLFVSGKVVLTGARSREDVYTAWQVMWPVLLQTRKGETGDGGGGGGGGGGLVGRKRLKRRLEAEETPRRVQRR